MNNFLIYKKNNIKTNRGFSLVEIVVACAIISVCTFALLSGASKGVTLSSYALRQAQGNTLLEEGAEAVKSIRDAAWANISGLTIGTTYYLSYDTGTNVWSPSLDASTIDSIFTRTIVLSAVYRDANDDIVASGGTLDAGTKKVTVNVSWATSSGTKTKTLEFYMSDIFS